MFIRKLRKLRSTVTFTVVASLMLSGCSNSSSETKTTSATSTSSSVDSPSDESPPAVMEKEADAGKAEIPLEELSLQAVADSIHTPAGLAIQPGSGHVFVSTSAGVLRLDPQNKFSVTTEINGFENDVYGKGPRYNLGPLGIGFLDEKTLVVGGGDLDDGKDVIRFYNIGPSAPDEPISADKVVHTVGPIAKGEHSHRGEGNYFGLAIQGSNIYLTSHGDDSKGWLSRIVCDGDSPGELEPLIPVKKSTHLDGPSGIGFLSDGAMVVSQTGELNEYPDAVLAVFNPETGELQRTISTGLYDITSILIHPESGRLYALDFAWALPEEGGLYSIDLSAEQPAVTKHAVLTHPTAMAVTADGDLIVSCVENQDEETEARGIIYTVDLE